MIRDISIHAVLNGFVVQVGCQTIVFNTVESLASNLVLYLNNPSEFEKEFVHTAINHEHTLPPPGSLVPPAEQAIARPAFSDGMIHDSALDPWNGIDMPNIAAQMDRMGQR